MEPHGPDDRVERAIRLAEQLLTASQQHSTSAERRQLRRLGRLLEDPQGRDLVQSLTDQVLRIDDHRRAARRLRDVVADIGVPRSLGRLDGVMLRLGSRLAPLMPRVVMPLATRRIRNETHGVVLSAADPAFARHATERAAEGVRLNVNVLGEAILSDAEADARLAAVRGRLARTDTDYVSVKISAICANLDPLAFEHSVERVATRLRTLYRDAMTHRTTSGHAKFVNLDMEEFKDLALTVAVFTRVLDEDEFAALDAGIVLQAYLPDSHDVLAHLGDWATARHARSGGRIKIRLVKGANLAMEQVDAETHGWHQAPYATKAEVDASYKRMLAAALDPAWRHAVRIGVASHNLFDVAWALVVRDDLAAADPSRRDQIEMEMLEGMAPAQARAVHAAAGDLLLYAPVVRPDDVDASIAYLSRRLDENTAPQNFLRALFTLAPNTAAFAEQADWFRASVAASETVSTAGQRAVPLPAADGFYNEHDTDFTLASERDAAMAAVAGLAAGQHNAGHPMTTDPAAIDTVIETARAAALQWAATSPAERASVLAAVASEMERGRFDTLALMADEAGKTLREGDPEVSEAIDFARYYGSVGIEVLTALALDGVEVAPKGVVLVVAPWNFPYAIPAGGVLAGLAAGNAVVLKPAPETRRIAWRLANQLWDAGVPRDVVQFVACDDNEVGRHLVTHDGVDSIVLTGAYDTAVMFTEWRPQMHLVAETSGKNAIVVTAAADIDAALRDIVRSAFGHAGQKCSAASLAIVEAAVYDDPTFHRRLAAAVQSATVGWPSEPATIVGPVISPPRGNLQRALTTLEPGESWLVQPRQLDDSGRLWSPGVRVGVAAGSWFHVTECFGPVLGLMRATDLDHAIELQNATPFGLTAGLHSLDPEEIRRWSEAVEAGNLYINRHITGAVVQRQPFGGWKRSSVGCGAKAGGPDAVLTLCTVHPGAPTPDSAAGSFEHWWQGWFGLTHDPTGLHSERNMLRYRPLGAVALVSDESTPPDAIEVARRAATRCGTPVVVVAAPTDEELLARCTAAGIVRVRALRPLSDAVRVELVRRGIGIDTRPVSSHGRVELPRWLHEQAISETTHRYGRLTPSALA